MAKNGATVAAKADLPATQEQGGAVAMAPSFAFMAMTNPEIIEENLGGEQLNPFDLDRLKVPAGGGIAWEIPTLTGEVEIARSIEGIVVYQKNCRGYWPDEYTGAATPPQCSSEDGVVGVGNPGGQCALCPMAQFGSSKNNSQACKAGRLLFLMTKDNILPKIISVPPTSIKPIKKFFLGLASKSIPYHGCVMSFALAPAVNKGGIKYAQIAPSLVAPLSPSEAALVKVYANTIRGSLNKVSMQDDLRQDATE